MPETDAGSSRLNRRDNVSGASSVTAEREHDDPGDLQRSRPWWNAGASHMNAALLTRCFVEHGLVSLLSRHRRWRVAS